MRADLNVLPLSVLHKPPSHIGTPSPLPLIARCFHFSGFEVWSSKKRGVIDVIDFTYFETCVKSSCSHRLFVHEEKEEVEEEVGEKERINDDDNDKEEVIDKQRKDKCC